MSKKFASAGDMTEKKISFTEIGRDLWAFTAEGDPNTGVIIGDDSVMIVEAQATPRLANKVIEKVRSVTDKPISHLVLTHYHAVRVLGASAYKAPTDHHEREGPLDGGRARRRKTGTASSCASRGCSRAMSRAFPPLTWPTTTFTTG
jgi:glyoxylase-like metal-dependent hydrolase (beta-lactamase superfamily II)